MSDKPRTQVLIQQLRIHRRAGYDVADLGNRVHYDNGCFDKMDRFCEKFPWQSPYVFAGNNPVNYVDVMGDSIYQMDSNGRITMTQATDDKYDELYVVDDKGSIKKDVSPLRLNDQSLLSGLSEQRKDYKGNYSVSKNGEEVLSVYTFASKNSDVEWAMSGLDGDSYVVNTSHLKGGVEDIMNSNSFNEKEETFHSHPGIDGTNGPSGNDEYKVDRYGPPMNRFIYHPATNSWYKYSSPIVPIGFEHFNGRHQSIRVKSPTIYNLKNPYYR